MTAAIVIHVVRPYESEEEYLDHESFSISARSMLLIDQPPLPLESVVVFDVSLQNGQKPIRAEGRVVANLEASSAGPAGVQVRFKRFGAATKAFVDRAVARSARASLSPPLASLPSIAAPAPVAAPSLAEQTSTEALNADTETPDAQERSGVHRKAIVPVAAPPNREALLARLRQRRAS